MAALNPSAIRRRRVSSCSRCQGGIAGLDGQLGLPGEQGLEVVVRAGLQGVLKGGGAEPVGHQAPQGEQLQQVP
ncbi:hypothetical protein CTI14_66395, partial [Methylobacterium radiotolerans]